MVFVHFINVLWERGLYIFKPLENDFYVTPLQASVVSSRHIADACSLYLLSFLLDSSVGLVIIYLLLLITTYLSKLYNLWYAVPGQYDDGSDLHSGELKRMLLPWSIQTFLFLLYSGIGYQNAA